MAVEYTVLSHGSASALQSEVSLLLDEGWTCTGGILFVTSPDGQIRYMQAMIR